jgi:hypothetical protein
MESPASAPGSRNDIVEQVAFKVSKGWRGLENVALGVVFFVRTTVRHGHDHPHGLAVGDQVVENNT